MNSTKHRPSCRLRYAAVIWLGCLSRDVLTLSSSSSSSMTSVGMGTFSVLEDLLAYPQFDVSLSGEPISPERAKYLLTHNASYNSSSSTSATTSAAATFRVNRTRELMILDNSHYVCELPPAHTPNVSTSQQSEPLSAEEAEKELWRVTQRGWDLLKSMKDHCIYYINGWWSYSFCFNQGVRQFHQLPSSLGMPQYPPIEDSSVQSFVLGTCETEDLGKGNSVGSQSTSESSVPTPENGLARVETEGETRYLVQHLGGGTKCDLTGLDRRIEIQFHCHPQSVDRIRFIKEISTCFYLMVIHTPRLCSDAAFLPPKQNEPQVIDCRPIQYSETDLNNLSGHATVGDNDRLEKSENIMLENDGSVLENHQSDTDSKLPLVGEIRVGAKSITGKSSKAIEKSAIVGGGKEIYLGTIASSKGPSMSEAEMKKLNIHDSNGIELLKKSLEKVARGRHWRLNVVDTPRGREFRGILDPENDATVAMSDTTKKSDERQLSSNNGNGNHDAPTDENLKTNNVEGDTPEPDTKVSPHAQEL